MIEYIPKGVCARKIEFNIEDGKVSDLSFVGGCDGNLKAISKLLEGMDVEDVIKTLEGNTCGMRSTSCTDQLSKALRENI